MKDRVLALVATATGQSVQNLDESSGPMRTAGWNSLAHITIISLVEQEFGFECSLQEITAVKSVADLLRLIEARSGAR